MIIRPSDRALTDDEWRTLLLEQDFGTLIAPGAGREFPIVSPSHFAFDGKETVVLHFVRDNPVWAALVERPVAILSVIGEYAYIPSYVNTGEEAPEEWGVPTSYYATVQLRCGTAIVDDPAELARLLTDLMAHFQPEGRHEPIEAGDNPYAQQFGAIRGTPAHHPGRASQVQVRWEPAQGPPTRGRRGVAHPGRSPRRGSARPRPPPTTGVGLFSE